MRHLQTPQIDLYYPARFADAARRVAARMDRCAAVIRAKGQPGRSNERILVFLTLTNFNNAYVQADTGGSPLQMVLPIHSTLEEDNFNLQNPVAEGNIACHESLHYVQDLQTHGFWRLVNLIGGSIASPSQGLERWFTEGLAVWTEGHIDLKTGRPNSPFWNGMFDSAMAARGNRMLFGDLSLYTRDLYGTGAYIASSHFIDYLTRRFGEQKVWDLIDREGGAVIPDIGMSLLFKLVFGQTLGSLVHDYSEEMAHQPIRTRPPEQRALVGDAGRFARIAVSPVDGSIAEVADGFDFTPRLIVRDASGGIRMQRSLTEFFPGARNWINLGAETVSGLRFTSDGKRLFFVGTSLSMDGDDISNIYELDARQGRVLRHWAMQGMGGDLTPDDRAYVYIRIDGDIETLMRLDLATGLTEELQVFEPMRAIGAPAVAPDGEQIAFSLWNGETFELALRARDGGLTILTNDGHTSYGPRWIDARHLLFLRERDGRWQVHVYDLSTRTIAPITNAPYVVLDAMPRGGEVVFLNMDGVHFSIDAAPLTPLSEPVPAVAANVAPPPLSPWALPPLQILSDRPVRTGDGLQFPTLHAPWIRITTPTVAAAPWDFIAGFSLAGSDYLGMHSYYVNVAYDTVAQTPSFDVQYTFAGLAPALLTLSVSRNASLTFGSPLSWLSDSRQASLSFSRTFWDIPMQVSLVGSQFLTNPTTAVAYVNGTTHPAKLLEGTPAQSELLVGPTASIGYAAAEATPYGGVLGGLRLGLSGGVYPAPFARTQTLESANGIFFLNSQQTTTVGDLRPTLGFTVPLPFSKRHSLSVDFVGHVMFGSGAFVEVGGAQPAYALSVPATSQSTQGATGSYTLLEPLQGYEDLARTSTWAVLGTASYRYPIIIDRGWPYFLWIFPSVFVSEVDVNLFGDAARLDNSWLRAVGGTVTLVTEWADALQINLVAQLAYRFDEPRQPVQAIFSLSL
jgi:hypothetical protein